MARLRGRYFELVEEFVVMSVGILVDGGEWAFQGVAESLPGTCWTQNEHQSSPERELKTCQNPLHMIWKTKTKEIYA